MPRSGVDRAVFGLATIALVGAVGFCYWSPSAVAEREREAARNAAHTADVASPGMAGPRANLDVRALRVTAGSAVAQARVSGLLAPLRSVTLSAEIGGAVREVLVEEHASVAAGDLLVRLDATALGAAVDRLEASRIRVESAHRLAKLDLERQRDLRERSVASSADLDRARNAERSAYGELGEIRAALVEARDRLAKTEIVAPFAGVVNWLDLEPGSYLQAGDRVAEVLDLSSIELRVGVTDHQVVALAEGDAVDVLVPVFPSQPFEGRIASIGRSAERQSQRYPIVVRVPNPEERLLPGMVAEAVLSVGGGGNSIQIPRRTTLREYELDYVYVLEERDGAVRASRRRVSVRSVPFRPELVEVTAGLRIGERIAASGIAELRDGLFVRIESDEPGDPS